MILRRERGVGVHRRRDMMNQKIIQEVVVIGRREVIGGMISGIVVEAIVRMTIIDRDQDDALGA